MNHPTHPSADENSDDQSKNLYCPRFCQDLLCSPMVFHPGDPVKPGEQLGVCSKSLETYVRARNSGRMSKRCNSLNFQPQIQKKRQLAEESKKLDLTAGVDLNIGVFSGPVTHNSLSRVRLDSGTSRRLSLAKKIKKYVQKTKEEQLILYYLLARKTRQRIALSK